MGITDIPIFSMLRTRMDWAQERQRLLAENVANSDTPQYRAKDLAPLEFREPGKVQTASVGPVNLSRTASSHLGGLSGGMTFQLDTKQAYNTSPGGNSVDLEGEMMKVAANQMDYQAATALYTRSLNLIKTAIGRR